MPDTRNVESEMQNRINRSGLLRIAVIILIEDESVTRDEKYRIVNILEDEIVGLSDCTNVVLYPVDVHEVKCGIEPKDTTVAFDQECLEIFVGGGTALDYRFGKSVTLPNPEPNLKIILRTVSRIIASSLKWRSAS